MAGSGFPWGILACNVVGSFLLGALAETFALTWNPPPEIRSLLVVGFLGAFTTFSTFSLDVALLYERGRIDLSLLYVAASVVLSVAGLFAGLRLVRTFAA
jgi:CrcB protein